MLTKNIYTITSTSTCMATTSITITREAYERLKRLKGKKSFSEVVMDLTSKPDIMQFAGIFKDVDLSSVENMREEINRGWKDRA